MKASIRKKLRRRKHRMEQRLTRLEWDRYGQPVMQASNIRYEIADRTRAISAGGIGAIHRMAQKIGLVDAINEKVPLLRLYLPYRESDHVLNIAYNLLVGGTRMEHIELRREDEVFLDAIGASRIPDPTTARDFCQRFTEDDVLRLTEAINDVRLVVWQQQPVSFFKEAFIDADGTIAETWGRCKEGMELAYNGQWGFHPLVISLANTQEPLYLVNRSGNRPSHEEAHRYLDRAIRLCRRGGFRRITLRGDNDFSQTKHLDRWDQDKVDFIFGYDSKTNLVAIADALPKSAWKPLPRRCEERSGPPRTRPENVKQRIVDERGFETIRTVEEHVAEFDYRPSECKKIYRMVVVRKSQTVHRGQRFLIDKSPYFFYITNKRKPPAKEIVLAPRGANGRCHQENLIDQLKHGVHAMDMPTNNLVSNGAYMVMASLAWTLKTWFALLLPEGGRWSDRRAAEKEAVKRMEFRTFLDALIHLPCQIARTSRRVVYRFLCWNRWQEVFFRFLDSISQLDTLHGRLRC